MAGLDAGGRSGHPWRMTGLRTSLQVFIPLFIAIDPIGLAAVFLAAGAGIAEGRRTRMARQAVVTGGVVALLFLLLGRTIFMLLGITVSDFEVGGGAILLVLAVRDITVAPESGPAPALPEDFGVVPLGLPLIAGPATIATLLLLTETQGLWPTLGSLAVNLGIVGLVFARSDWISRFIGEKGLRAVSKIVSLLLAAIAVSMMRRGWYAR